ncbi:hypothetical protein KV205_09050 [Streptomyces sp. SKN60]|nr:hypothetical protein [Streptomyces sp. SKN60]
MRSPPARPARPSGGGPRRPRPPGPPPARGPGCDPRVRAAAGRRPRAPSRRRCRRRSTALARRGRGARGPRNVHPRESEEVLYEHPAVAEAAVVGTPHPLHGEEVAAVVVLRAGAEATAEEIRAYVRERVAAYKYPRVVSLVGELPKGPTGKILKREITVTVPRTRV